MKTLLISIIVIWAMLTATYHFLEGDEKQRQLTPNSSIGPVRAFFELQSRMMNDISDFVGSIADSFSVSNNKEATQEAIQKSGLYKNEKNEKEEGSS